jgi:uncharacterized membrane protein YiaA
MKKVILIFLAIIFSANLYAQRNNYPSKEMDKYYKKLCSTSHIEKIFYICTQIENITRV